MKAIPSIKYFLSSSVLVYLLVSCASSNGYLSNNFEKVRVSHQKVAILPFKVRFNYNGNDRRNQRNPEKFQQFVADQEFMASKDAQQELFLQLARQIRKGRFELALQDYNTTNKILDENKIRLERLNDNQIGSLATVLGVDAIFLGNLDVRVTANNQFQMMPMNRINDGVDAELKLFDADSSEMLWNLSFSQRPNSPNDTPHRITTNLMDSFAKSVPYRVKR